MDTVPIDAARRIIGEIVRSGRVPGIVLAVQRGGAPAEYVVVGTDAEGRPLDRESLFLVASITKMATALAVLRLADAGALALDDLLRDYLPAAEAARDGVTLRALLCHTSGMPMDVPNSDVIYQPGLNWTELAHACLLTPLEAEPETRVQYSNAGYGLLAQVVEQRSGYDFAAALEALVLEPLRIEGYLGVEPPRPPVRVADVRGRYAGTELEPFDSAFYRSLALPWAGLVTTVDGALAIVQAFGGRAPGFLREETRKDAVRNQTGELSGGFRPPLMWSPCTWALGPELRGDKRPHWTPESASPESFGHSGASGCIAWRDPAADVAWAMLGTRTAENGWLLRRSPLVAAAILQAAGE